MELKSWELVILCIDINKEHNGNRKKGNKNEKKKKKRKTRKMQKRKR